jgi:hypothetical protein
MESRSRIQETKMEIAPIAGIRLMPLVPRTMIAGEIAPVFDIFDLERMSGDSYRTRNEESRGGMQNESDDLMDGDDDEFSGPLFTPTGKREVGRRLNCFA